MQHIERPRPKGPIRMTNAKGVEVGIFPNYRSAIMTWMPGDTMAEIAQEEFDREMAEWRASRAR